MNWFADEAKVARPDPADHPDCLPELYAAFWARCGALDALQASYARFIEAMKNKAGLA